MVFKTLICLTFVLVSVYTEFTEHRKEILDGEGKYLVEWSIDYENKIVKFNLTVQTEGYIGFGISPTGGMRGADIFIGGLHTNGTPYYSDRHGIGETEPVIDDHEDWNFIRGSFNGTHTKLELSRVFDTCDDRDVPLTNDTTNFIWAYSSRGTDEIGYHGSNRGTFTVQPLDPETPPIDLTQYMSYEIKHNMTMPSADTTYWCTIHKSPRFTLKHHIVAFEPLLNSPEAIAHTHHYNIFRCTAPDNQDPEAYFEKYIDQAGGECYVPNPVVPTPNCQTMFYNWAVGGRMLILPENIGYPIGEMGSPVDYYMFEIHYNNPQKLSVFNYFIYYTDEPRKHDAGLMVVAHHTSISLTVPPKSMHFNTVGHCDPICTKSYLPQDGIDVFAIFLHAHLSGRKMRFRQFRGTEELPWPANDETYDFEFQQTRILRNNVKILPGDQLTIECTYDTTWREGTTVGGLSTSDEMCQSIFWYYPRAELRDCRSEYPIDKLFEKFGIETANRSTPYEDAVVTAPPKYAGMRYTEVLNAADWTEELREEIQTDSNISPHVGVCMTPTKMEYVTTGYPVITGDFKPVNVCDIIDDTGKSTVISPKFLIVSTYAMLAFWLSLGL